MISKYAAMVCAIALAASPLNVMAQEFGDSQQGLVYAKMICAECHAVERTGAPSPNPNAPPFVSVSRTSGMTATALRVWLQTSHPTMPNLVMKAEDRDNLVAYILSLKGK